MRSESISAIDSTEPQIYSSELTEICTQMVEFYQKVMPRVIMMTQTKSALPPFRDSQLFAGYLERAIDLGLLKPCDSMVVAHAIVGAIHNYVMTQTIAEKIPFPLPFILPKLKSTVV